MDFEDYFYIPPGELMWRQRPSLAKIIRDEIWHEGRRRGREVSETDPVVNLRACAIVFKFGKGMRQEAWLDAVTDRLSPIIHDETWYEGEARGHLVAPSDPAVVALVQRVLVEKGINLPEPTLILIIKRFEERWLRARQGA